MKHVGPSPKPVFFPHCSAASLPILCLFKPLLLVSVLFRSPRFLGPCSLAMPFLTAGTAFKQLEGHPSFISPKHHLLQALLESACLPQEKRNTCFQIPAPLAGPLCPLSALYSSVHSPHAGCMPGLPSNQGRKIAPGRAKQSH